MAHSQRVSAVLFDFDGVIADSEPLHCRAYLETAALLKVPLTEDRYYSELIGYDDRGAIAHLYRAAGMPCDELCIARFLNQKTSRALQLIHSGEFQPLPGVTQLISALRERNIALGICSGALRAELTSMLDGLRLSGSFGAITAAEDVDVGKPDPRGYLLTAQRLSEMIGHSLAPQDCLVIEDAPNVARRAAQAGFRVLGVATTFEPSSWPADVRVVRSLEPRVVRGVVPELEI